MAPEVLPLQPRRWYFYCRAGHPLAEQVGVSAQTLLQYPLAATLRSPNLRKVIGDLSGQPDFVANVACENSYSLLGVVLNSDAIGICTSNSASGDLVRLNIEGLAEDCEALYSRYGIVSRARMRLSPLAEAMIEQIVRTDQDRETARLDRLAV